MSARTSSKHSGAHQSADEHSVSPDKEFEELLAVCEKKTKARWRYVIRKRDGSLAERHGWPLFLPSPRRARAIAKRLRGAKVERYVDYAPETRGRKRGTGFFFRNKRKSAKSRDWIYKAGMDEALNRATARFLFMRPEKRPRGYPAWLHFFEWHPDRDFFRSPLQSGTHVAVSRQNRSWVRALTQEIQRRAREIERSQRRS